MRACRYGAPGQNSADGIVGLLALTRRQAVVRALLFDFFGTMVQYQPDRSRLGSPRTHELARSMRYAGDHEAFVGVWDAASHALEQEARRTLREFSMTDAAAAFAGSAGLPLAQGQVEALGRSFVSEWAQHVSPIPGVSDLIRQLAERWSIAVVSNPHDRDMVPNMLDTMSIGADVSSIVLSVDHGWLKPHPSIYSAALENLGCEAADAVFVGDSYDADYAGPIRAGMSAYLIDPTGRYEIPAHHRLGNVTDIVAATAGDLQDEP